jgi:glycolate oxidase iron-sulfur subunit
VTACPSGVKYGDLITSYRVYSEGIRKRGLLQSVRRGLVRGTLPYPTRFRFLAALGQLVRPFRRFVPDELRGMLSLLPGVLPTARPLPPLIPAEGLCRARVALLTGCVQQALSPEINWSTVRVLARNGVEVVIPPGQNCCGALAMHCGEAENARMLARANLRSFPTDVDAIITNAAGCGSGIHEYSLLFQGAPDSEEIQAFARRVKDVSVFLAELGILPPPFLPKPLKLAYHDACHLVHAQGVSEAPRRLLRSIPNLVLLEVSEGDLCCGSAGIYNIEQPEIAEALGQKKVRNILGTGAEAVAAGNIGCLVQIRAHLEREGKSLPVYHTLEVLDRAYRGKDL